MHGDRQGALEETTRACSRLREGGISNRRLERNRGERVCPCGTGQEEHT